MHSRRAFSTYYSPNETNIIYTCNLQTIYFCTEHSFAYSFAHLICFCFAWCLLCVGVVAVYRLVLMFLLLFAYARNAWTVKWIRSNARTMLIPWAHQSAFKTDCACNAIVTATTVKLCIIRSSLFFCCCCYPNCIRFLFVASVLVSFGCKWKWI